MKYFQALSYLSVALLFALLSCKSLDKEETTDEHNEILQIDTLTQDKPIFNAAFAEKIGADEFGMKSYFFVFLTEGEARMLDSVERMQIQREHLANIRQLADEKKIVLAGPFLDRGDLRGLFIIDSDSLQEAHRITRNDPAVAAGVLNYEIFQWYGPAVLTLVYGIHPYAAKTRI